MAVALERNSRGLRQQSRALHLAYEERRYSYTSLGAGKGAVFRGDHGPEISLVPGAHGNRAGVVSLGRASDSADAMDLDLALVFEEVETAALSLAGAAMLAPVRLINYNSREPVA
ncbi:hypothetical protein [Streptomyces telluris]|uniref:Uncharacterized protein n=1 Tax=Streptomyces telluris TaxID=2720021 RepID=A0A9X2LQE4_9ACTN|nr:hypothetical protein [Streptomyces telluris]MCQ8775076.1 hypothetical protein [Streptomyces telluris]